MINAVSAAEPVRHTEKIQHDTRNLWTHLGAGKWEVGEAVAALAKPLLVTLVHAHPVRLRLLDQHFEN